MSLNGMGVYPMQNILDNDLASQRANRSIIDKETYLRALNDPENQ
jgi:hypothetical protein